MPLAADTYEKLGYFYLGREVDPADGGTSAEPLLYDSRDLVTHAVILGMTGSGKTGLGIGLLEEAAIDGVPALVIDPKGDLSNLLLTFPDLRPADFEPWLRAEEAERQGVDVPELAAAEAEKWRSGLAAWGQDGERIRRLRAAGDVTLYTPGSELARPISILASFAAPPEPVRADADLFRDRVEIAATSLLTLAGVEADPLRSREHILVSTLLAEAWRSGRDYDLSGLIADLQRPPVARVGVMDLETFFPAAARFELALAVNGLLAAPGFEVWLRGEPLALDSLLYGPGGRPRLAVVSLAHLSDAERMFFVALLLNETVAWMRSKSGTGSLRALLYMDEIFGYLPPVANPPSKKPMLVLLKQARAYGLGLVLATQNPVDLDYRALANIGTWFLGRLQTERDKARVLDGLEGASTAAGDAFDRASIDRLLSGLRSRRFLLHNVHERAPVLFETRWAMSYLAGPLDREQLRALARDRDAVAGSPSSGRAGGVSEAGGIAGDAAGVEGPAMSPPSSGPSAARPEATGKASGHGEPPVLAPTIPQVFFSVRGRPSSALYRPALLGVGRAFVEDARKGVAQQLDRTLLARFESGGAIDWLGAETIGPGTSSFDERPADGSRFAPLPARAARPESYAKWEKDLALALARSASVTLLRSKALGELSRPGEDERAFRIRLAETARERRDARVAKVRDRYASRLAAIEERIRRAEARVEAERQEASSEKLSSLLGGAASVAGVLFGRRRISATSVGRIGTAVRSFGRSSKQAGDVERARETVAALREQAAALAAEIERAVAAAGGEGAADAAAEALEPVVVRPKRADVEVVSLALAWVPEA
jgi:hypothetical protein